MTLRQKLAVTFGLVLALVGIEAGFTVLLLNNVVRGSAQLVAPALQRVDDLAHAQSDMLRLRALEYSYLTETSPTAADEVTVEMAQVRASIRQHLDDYAGLDLPADRAALLGTIKQKYQGYLNSLVAAEDAVQQGDRPGALREYVNFQQSFLNLDNLLHDLRHREYAATESLQSQMVELAGWVRWPIGVMVAVVALGEAFLGWYLSGSISQSIRVLLDGAKRIGQRRFDEPVPIPPEVELAVLGETLNSVMDTLARDEAEQARLEQERLRLLRAHLGQVVRAQEEERARVSRELHDQAGQALTALSYGLSRTQRLCHEPVVAAEIGRMLSLASEAGGQIRSLARDLRPAVLDDLGLVPALRSYVRDFADRIALPIRFSVKGSIPRLPSEAETTVFRVVQEALTNVAKHAQASHAWVDLRAEGEQVEVEVRDDGCGFHPEEIVHKPNGDGASRPGLGLAGIQERVHLLQGDMRVESADGRGTSVGISFPLTPAMPAPSMAEGTRAR